MSAWTVLLFSCFTRCERGQRSRTRGSLSAAGRPQIKDKQFYVSAENQFKGGGERKWNVSRTGQENEEKEGGRRTGWPAGSRTFCWADKWRTKGPL